MTDFVYDEETYPNFFSIGIKDPVSKEYWAYEISDRVDDQNRLRNDLWNLAGANHRLVGFNNEGFDYPILHLIFGTTYIAPHQLYQMAQSIIDTPWNDRFRNVIRESDRHIPQIDLFKIHHFDSVSRSTSLKQIEFAMQMENIQDLPYPPGSFLTDEQKDHTLDYMRHDVTATYLFHGESLEQIAFRDEMSAQYGRDFTNFSDPKVGEQYFLRHLEEKAPGCTTHIVAGRKEPRQTHRPSINLGEAVFPYIKFRNPEFQRMCDWFRSQTITQTKGVFEKLSCTVDGFQYDFGAGGIHGSVSSQTVVADGDNVIIDLDVASYYPNIAIANRVHPAHLGEIFCDIYEGLYNQRRKTEKGSALNKMLKLALNATYGKSNSKFSSFYDPLYTMTITINGQLLLCLLAEMLSTIKGLKMVQINTDGLTVKVHKNLAPFVESVALQWEVFTHLQLESVQYSRMFIRDVNNYIGEYTDGKLKRKGAYDWKDLDWNQNFSSRIVAKAAEVALVRGEDIAQFIHQHEDIFDFMLFAKVPRNCKLLLNEIEIQSRSRYFISDTGGALIKIMPPTKPQLLKNPEAPDRRITYPGTKGWLVTECNDMATFNPSQLNHDYYIAEAEKLVKPLQGITS